MEGKPRKRVIKRKLLETKNYTKYENKKNKLPKQANKNSPNQKPVQKSEQKSILPLNCPKHVELRYLPSASSNGVNPNLPRVIRDGDGQVIEYHSKEGLRYTPGMSAYVNTALLRPKDDPNTKNLTLQDYKRRRKSPYMIVTISEIKVTHLRNAIIHATSFCRSRDLPENVFHLLWHDRHSDFQNVENLPTLFQSPELKSRELFQTITETSNQENGNSQCSLSRETFPASALVGICQVKHLKSMSISSARKMKLDKDTFFYQLGYNPELKRLMNASGECRLGAAYEWTADQRGLFQEARLPSKSKTRKLLESGVYYKEGEQPWESETVTEWFLNSLPRPRQYLVILRHFRFFA